MKTELYSSKYWTTILLIAFSSTIFRIMLQAIISSNIGLQLPESIIVKSGLLPVAFTIYAFIGYSLLILVFVFLEKNLFGNRLQKGFEFGILFAGMWVVYLFEPTGIPSNATFVELLYYPIADGLALILLGILSGYFLSTESEKKQISDFNIKMILFPIIFLLFRLVEYTFFKIISDFDNSPVNTVLWVIITGIWFGIMYSGLMEQVNGFKPLQKAIIFSIFVIGINLFIFNFFIPLVFQTDVIDLIIRSVLDICSLFIASFLFEKTKKTSNFNNEG